MAKRNSGGGNSAAGGARVLPMAGITDGNAPGQRLHRGKYDPMRFIIPGQDQNGMSTRLHCRVPPALDRIVDVIHGSKRFPFRCKGDLVRWAVKEGVELLQELETVPQCKSLQAQVDAMTAFLNDEDSNHAFLQLFDRMTGTIGMHIAAQAHGEARRIVTELKGIITGIESEYWRGRYQKALEEKFGYLLKGSYTRGASLDTHTHTHSSANNPDDGNDNGNSTSDDSDNE